MPSKRCEDVSKEFVTAYPARIAFFEFLFAVIALCCLVGAKKFHCGFRLHLFRLIIMVFVWFAFYAQNPNLLLAYIVLKVYDFVILVHFLAELIFSTKDKRVNMLDSEILADHWKAAAAAALVLTAVVVGCCYVFCVTAECMPFHK